MGGTEDHQNLNIMQREYRTSSADETIALGRTLAPELSRARIVLLRGDLGAGKTTFTKGVAEALDAASQDNVTSPTFTLIHEYRGPTISIFHIDLYRIENERDLATLGLEDMINEEGNLLLIEWGEKFPRLVRERDLEIVFTRTGESERRIQVVTDPTPVPQ